MLRVHEIAGLLALPLVALWAVFAMADQTIGGACSGTRASTTQSADGNNTVCISGAWQYPAYQFGASAASCNATGAGTVQWTGSALQYCNGTSWALIGTATGGTSGALSGLTGATGANTIDNAANAQTWTWNSLTTGTAFKLSTSSMTSGTLLALASTKTGSTGQVLSVTTSGGNYGISSSAAGTGNTYAVYGENTGSGNTGVSGYFYNKSTSGANYGVYGKSDSTSGIGVTGNATSSTGSTTGVQAFSSSPNGIAVSAANVSTTGSAIAVQGTSSSTGTGFGIYGIEDGAGNTGYAGYFNNSATSGANYGVYGTNASPSGYGGYFTNTATLGAAGYFNGGIFSVWAVNATTIGSGVYAYASAASGSANGLFGQSVVGTGVRGLSNGTTGYAGYFQNAADSGVAYGVYGETNSTSGYGVNGNSIASSGTTYGVYGSSGSASGYGVYGANSTGSVCSGYLASTTNSAGGNCKSSFPSDRRMKKDVVVIPDGIRIVMALKPVSFLWKSDRKNPPLVTDPAQKSRSYGFIAQEVEEVLPDLVDHATYGIGKIEGLDEPKEGFLELNYDGFIAPIVKAVQEQQAEIDQQRGEIDQLKAADARLKAANDNLRQEIALLKKTMPAAWRPLGH